MIDWGWLLFPIVALICSLVALAVSVGEKKDLADLVNFLKLDKEHLLKDLATAEAQIREERLTAKIQELVRANADLAVNAKVVKAGK